MFLPAIGFSIGHQTGPHQGLQPLQNKIQDLSQNLASGALTGAQKAFPAVQQDLQKIQSVQQTNQTTNSNNSLGNDIQGLAQSLTSGDLAGVQKAVATLEQALQTAGAGRHHQRQGIAPTQAAATYATGSSTTSGTGVQAVGRGISVSA
jgi:protein subunit release factor A